jgi:hypothetical protein
MLREMFRTGLRTPNRITFKRLRKRSTDPYTFGADWESGSITSYYDGKQVGKATSGVVNNPMFLILNNGVSNSIAGPIQVPSSIQVDYVKVWQH